VPSATGRILPGSPPRTRGMLVKHKRVAQLMREDNLLGVQPKSFVVTTDSFAWGSALGARLTDHCSRMCHFTDLSSCQTRSAEDNRALSILGDRATRPHRSRGCNYDGEPITCSMSRRMMWNLEIAGRLRRHALAAMELAAPTLGKAQRTTICARFHRTFIHSPIPTGIRRRSVFANRSGSRRMKPPMSAST